MMGKSLPMKGRPWKESKDSKSTLQIKVSFSLYFLQWKTKRGDMLETGNCIIWCTSVVYTILYLKNIIKGKNGLYKD